MITEFERKKQGRSASCLCLHAILFHRALKRLSLNLRRLKVAKEQKELRDARQTVATLLTLSFFKNKVGETVKILQGMQQVLAFKSLLQKARREYLGTKKWREASEFILNFFKRREQELLAEPSTDPILQQ
jgi:hypothetical protein